MSGTPAGGRKAAAVNKARHGQDFYVRIGGLGGRKSRGGGFAKDSELARIAGAKGGRASKKHSRQFDS